jgi:hypothetical protein
MWSCPQLQGSDWPAIPSGTIIINTIKSFPSLDALAPKLPTIALSTSSGSLSEGKSANNTITTEVFTVQGIAAVIIEDFLDHYNLYMTVEDETSGQKVLVELNDQIVQSGSIFTGDFVNIQVSGKQRTVPSEEGDAIDFAQDNADEETQDVSPAERLQFVSINEVRKGGKVKLL